MSHLKITVKYYKILSYCTKYEQKWICTLFTFSLLQTNLTPRISTHGSTSPPHPNYSEKFIKDTLSLSLSWVLFSRQPPLTNQFHDEFYMISRKPKDNKKTTNSSLSYVSSIISINEILANFIFGWLLTLFTRIGNKIY